MGHIKRRDRPRDGEAAGPDQGEVLLRLYDAVGRCRQGGHPRSRTAKLIAAGPRKMAQKLVEEAAEVALEAVRHHRHQTVTESADMLYHLIVLWSELGIPPAEVFAELTRRETLSGLAEKPPKPSAVTVS